jgi:hypothetical protein
MRPDAYTKVVLTVIAVALVYLCAASAPVGTSVQAQLGPTQVVIAGWYDSSQQRVVPLSSAQGLPVASAGLGLPSGDVPMPAATLGAPTPATAVSPRPSAPATSGRCQATTQKGSQCSRAAKAGSRFCWQHGGEE